MQMIKFLKLMKNKKIRIDKQNFFYLADILDKKSKLRKFFEKSKICRLLLVMKIMKYL